MEGSLSPSTDASSVPTSAGWERPEKFSSASRETSQEDQLWSHLSPDLQFYLAYHRTELTYHHWFFKHDANHFLHHILIDQALSYDPLLYAVAGFAAYQWTVKQPNGKMQDFLRHYDKSVSLLLRSLQDNQKHTDATMLTILQLATFEVGHPLKDSTRADKRQDYLGDWVNLLGHQKAAHRMLLELYSPHSIMETEIRRKILVWYFRFDVQAGIMDGHSIFMGREWFLAAESYYREQSLSYPLSIDYKIEAMIATNRLFGSDLALLYAKLPQGDITPEDFARESDRLFQKLDFWNEDLDPVFRNEDYLVKSFGGQRPDSDDIVDPYQPGGLYKGALFTFNYMIVDWLTLRLMHKYKTALLLCRPPPPEVQDIALEICRIFEAIEYWSESPPGAVVKGQGGLGLAIVFLPRDKKHIMWCRQKLAKVESLGYNISSMCLIPS